MALVACPECKKRISETAESCPNCGRLISLEDIDRAKKSKKKQESFVAIGCLAPIILVGFLLIRGESCGDTSSTPIPKTYQYWEGSGSPNLTTESFYVGRDLFVKLSAESNPIDGGKLFVYIKKSVSGGDDIVVKQFGGNVTGINLENRRAMVFGNGTYYLHIMGTNLQSYKVTVQKR